MDSKNRMIGRGKSEKCVTELQKVPGLPSTAEKKLFVCLTHCYPNYFLGQNQKFCFCYQGFIRSKQLLQINNFSFIYF